jgi:hypothetical protein
MESTGDEQTHPKKDPKHDRLLHRRVECNSTAAKRKKLSNKFYEFLSSVLMTRLDKF